LADPNLITSPAVFPVVIDPVPIDVYSETKSIKKLLAKQNPIPLEIIQSIQWLSKPSYPGQTSGTILVIFLDKDLTRRMIRGSVYFEGNSLRVRAYKKSRVQCFCCQEPSQITLQCINHLLCKHCGADTDSRTSPKCVRCVTQDTMLNPDIQIDKTSEKYTHTLPVVQTAPSDQKACLNQHPTHVKNNQCEFMKSIGTCVPDNVDHYR
ncbi:hypothetical protein CROQUDRAFT_48774, partial [Cronartium quercuum f. sp. fusiforme G11]